MKSQMKMKYLLLDKRSTLRIISKEYLSENGKWNENEIITCEKGVRFKKPMCSQAVRLEKYLKKHIYLWTSGAECKHLNIYSWGKRSEIKLVFEIIVHGCMWISHLWKLYKNIICGQAVRKEKYFRKYIFRENAKRINILLATRDKQPRSIFAEKRSAITVIKATYILLWTWDLRWKLLHLWDYCLLFTVQFFTMTYC